MERQRLFRRDFSLVVLGQIISLFGNAVLRFALPLYLFDQTQSPWLLGLVSAAGFLPMVLLTPVGGIVADRVDKKKIMVALDFATAALVLGLTLALRSLSLVPVLLVALMLLYGIQGAYQPAVQASMPLLADGEQLMTANAVINMVSSLAGLVGPTLGGILYSANGIWPVLGVSGVCFFLSAVMEIFIHIPHAPRARENSVWRTVRTDMGQSLRHIFREAPVLGQIIWVVFFFNFFLTSMLIVGLQVILRQTLEVSALQYSWAESALAAGGLVGGMLAGVLGPRMRLGRAHRLLLLCCAELLPMGLALLAAPRMVGYWVILVMSFLLMVCATLFSVQTMSYVQRRTPDHMVGKVISCLLAISIAAQPMGQAMYGLLFEYLPAAPIVLGAALAAALIALAGRAAFRRAEE